MTTFKPPCHEHRLEFNPLIYPDGQLRIIRCLCFLNLLVTDLWMFHHFVSSPPGLLPPGAWVLTE